MDHTTRLRRCRHARPLPAGMSSLASLVSRSIRWPQRLVRPRRPECRWVVGSRSPTRRKTIGSGSGSPRAESLLFFAGHIFTSPSRPPEAIHWPVGSNASAVTVPMWALIALSSLPDRSQMRIVLSNPPVASLSPAAFQARAQTISCDLIVCEDASRFGVDQADLARPGSRRPASLLAVRREGDHS